MVGKMTSRERVRKALEFEQTDRVPIDIGGTKMSGIHVDEYIRLGEHLGIDVELPRIYEQMQMIARPDELIRRRLHADVIEVENPSERWGLENRDWKPWTIQAGHKVLMPGNFDPEVGEDGSIVVRNAQGNRVAYMQAGGLYFEPVQIAEGTGGIRKIDPDDWKRAQILYTEEELKQLERIARFFHEYTEYSVHGGFLKGSLRNNNMANLNITDWLCALVLERDYAASILEATTERALENLELYLEAVGDYIDTILISGADYGTQKGPLFDPEIFWDLYVPNYGKMNEYVHENSSVKTMFHSCGAIWDLLDGFIAAGVDIINPVQVAAGNMDPRELKRRVTNKMVIWGGGVDTQDVLPFGSAADVVNQVQERLSIFAPSGGFIFAPIHNIQFGVPPENIIAMVDTVAAWRPNY
jgi:uroporphyrinogen decarboxylase